MSTPTDAVYGSLFAALLAGVDVALAAWQWIDRRPGGADLSPENRLYYKSRDVRRSIVILVLALLSLGIFYGSRLPHVVDERPNPRFLATWLTVFGLVLSLISLALIDWFATRRFARRNREAIVREGMELIRDELRLRVEQKKAKGLGSGSNGVA